MPKVSDCDASLSHHQITNNNKKRKRRSKRPVSKNNNRNVRQRKKRKIIKNEQNINLFVDIEIDFDATAKQNILKCLTADNSNCHDPMNGAIKSSDLCVESSHLMSLIAQQSQFEKQEV